MSKSLTVTIDKEHSRPIDSDNAYYTAKITLPGDIVIKGEYRVILSSNSCYPDDEFIAECELIGIDEYRLQEVLEANVIGFQISVNGVLKKAANLIQRGQFLQNELDLGLEALEGLLKDVLKSSNEASVELLECCKSMHQENLNLKTKSDAHFANARLLLKSAESQQG